MLWGDGKKQTTNTYCWFIAHWAKHLSWQEVAAGVSHVMGRSVVAKMILRHEGLILNWFRAKGEISNGIVEGLNDNLPTPEFTHRFW